MPQWESKFSTPVSSLYVLLLQFAGCLQNFMSVLDKASQTKVLARKIWYLKCKIISWKQNENWTSLQYYLGKYDLLQKIIKERFNPASEKRKNIAQSFYPGYDSPNRQQTPRNPLNCTCGLLQVHLRAASGIQMFSLNGPQKWNLTFPSAALVPHLQCELFTCWLCGAGCHTEIMRSVRQV